MIIVVPVAYTYKFELEESKLSMILILVISLLVPIILIIINRIKKYNMFIWSDISRFSFETVLMQIYLIFSLDGYGFAFIKEVYEIN